MQQAQWALALQGRSLANRLLPRRGRIHGSLQRALPACVLCALVVVALVMRGVTAAAAAAVVAVWVGKTIFQSSPDLPILWLLDQVGVIAIL